MISIPPGLNLSQIQKIVETLPFELPNEVYELYQWSCGINEETSYSIYYVLCPFDPYADFTVCSLEETVNSPTFEDKFGRPINYLGKPLFQLFMSERSHIFVIGSTEKQQSSSVILWTPEQELILRYTSLTTMMLTLAECLETKSVCENDILYDADNTFHSIYRKYNHAVPELVINYFWQYILTVPPELNETYEILDAWENFNTQVYFLKQSWEDLSFNQLNSELTETLTAATQHEDANVKGKAKRIIELFVR